MQGFSWQHLLCLLIMLFNLEVICSSSFFSPSEKLCSPDQSLALLDFKKSISIDSSASSHCFPYNAGYPKTISWKEGSDCCSWDGVSCDRITGHVVALDLSSSLLLGTFPANSSLFLLRHLEKLNLACNDFKKSEISSKFGWFTKLTSLNLSQSHFSGQIPPEISHLFKLVSLDLTCNYFAERGVILDQPSFYNLLQNLTELRYLDLDWVDMSAVAPASLVNLSSSLISLNLDHAALHGEFPTESFRFPFLQRLSLSSNSFLTGSLPVSNWSSPLKLLDLHGTSFSGKLPDTIGNLMHLNELDLSNCDFKGSIPASLWNLTGIAVLMLANNDLVGQVSTSLSNLKQLTHLDLARNNFSGQMPSSVFNLSHLSYLDFSHNQFEGHFPCHPSNLSYLIELHLSYNFLNGKLPSWLFTLPSLESLELGNNNLRGPIADFQQPVPLRYVVLSNNEICGRIPNSISKLVNLTILDLSSNNLSGVVKSVVFSRLKNLVYFDLKDNTFLSLVTYGNENFTLPKLHWFVISSCNLSEIPIFLKNSENLHILDLSNNMIHGQISQDDSKLWHNLIYLNLSHNSFTSFKQPPSMNYILYLDLHSNLLQGSLESLPDSMVFFSVSHNKLNGDIPSSFCKSTTIVILDLSNNNLTGMIPQCLVNCINLSVLDLRKNNFQGSFPQKFAEHNALEILNLNGNQLEGPLPISLVNCGKLNVLDVGNNKINGTFPNWLVTLPRLQVLILRSNRFQGPIDDSKAADFPFSELRIVDISHNEFTGRLPTVFFDNFKAMMRRENDLVEMAYMGDNYYQYSVILTMKGIDIEMSRVLTIFTTIDLSNNQFQGWIPPEVGKLNLLKVLNFSYNNLTGYIPSSLENLTELESLDLSINKLVGEIPRQLTNLYSLSVLNLSYNQLVGLIPQGKQFNTFENNSYIGNLGLCGLPLLEKCNNHLAPKPAPAFHEQIDIMSWFDWKIIMMGYASGLVIGLSLGYIVFSTGRPRRFVRMVEKAESKGMRRLKRCIRKGN